MNTVFNNACVKCLAIFAFIKFPELWYPYNFLILHIYHCRKLEIQISKSKTCDAYCLNLIDTLGSLSTGTIHAGFKQHSLIVSFIL